MGGWKKLWVAIPLGGQSEAGTTGDAVEKRGVSTRGGGVVGCQNHRFQKM